jgi:hypothetical protein
LASLSPLENEAVRKAIDSMRKKDIFEKVLGREMRRAGLEYEAYVRIISDIRDVARKEKVDLLKGAEIFLSKQE